MPRTSAFLTFLIKVWGWRWKFCDAIANVMVILGYLIAIAFLAAGAILEPIE